MIDLYLSHRYPFTVFADMLGYGVGTRADGVETNRIEKTLDEGIEIEFVDNDFKNPDIDRILEVARNLSPKVCVCPDIFDEESVSEVIKLSNELLDIGTTPIIVPKTEFDKQKLPNEYILGYSVESDYGSTDVSDSFFVDEDIHLLGGNLKNQIHDYERLRMGGSNIVSIDTNYFFNSASFGNVVNCADHILNRKNLSENDISWMESWEGRCLVSILRYYEFWQKKTNKEEDLSGSLLEH